MIEVKELTKEYGGKAAVEGLSFTVRPGQVTGFLGPNGAGKSTTMRVILGLAAPTSGSALVKGRRLADLDTPMRHVGALLDADAVHPGRSAEQHLRWMARSNGLSGRRVWDCLEKVGLASVAGKAVGEFSLGMKQRLGIAGALLGDPEVLLFDEPVNGLDPEGVRWIRELLKGLADEGRTILLSSHLMSEMAQTAEDLVVIGRGRLIAETTVRDLAERFGSGVIIRSRRAPELAGLLDRAGADVRSHDPPDGLTVQGIDAELIGKLAAEHGIPLYELTPRNASLEEAYLRLTAHSVEYRSGPADGEGTW